MKKFYVAALTSLIVALCTAAVATAGAPTVSPKIGKPTTVFKVTLQGGPDTMTWSLKVSKIKSTVGPPTSCLGRATKASVSVEGSNSIQLPVGPDYGFSAKKKWCKGKYIGKVKYSISGAPVSGDAGTVKFSVK